MRGIRSRGGPRRRAARIARTLRLSLELMAAHRTRTALSLSGLSVGVAIVIVMAAVGEGAERRIVERVRAMGTNLLIVTASPAPRVAGRVRQTSMLTALRIGDAQAVVEETPLALGAAPLVSRTLVAKFEDRNSTVVTTGTTPDGLRLRGVRALAGRVFDETEERERRRVALLGPTVSNALFQGADPVGREVRIHAVPFEVIGVLAARGTDLAGTDLDNEIVIPLETAMRRLFNVPYVHAILVQGAASDQLPALESDVRAILLRRHPVRSGEGSIESFIVQNQAVLLRTERAAARTFNRMIVAVASLALVVGGVGIAAVMLLAVRDRRREIGLRRALGARRDDIALQFLLESAVLALGGATAGVVAGLLGAMLASSIGGWAFALPSWALFAGLCSSLILGMFAGVVPARLAARLEPSVALRAG